MNGIRPPTKERCHIIIAFIIKNQLSFTLVLFLDPISNPGNGEILNLVFQVDLVNVTSMVKSEVRFLHSAEIQERILATVPNDSMNPKILKIFTIDFLRVIFHIHLLMEGVNFTLNRLLNMQSDLMIVHIYGTFDH